MLLYDILSKENYLFSRMIDARDYKKFFTKPRFRNELKKFFTIQSILISSLFTKNIHNRKTYIVKQLCNFGYNIYWLICQFLKDIIILQHKAYIPDDIDFDNNLQEYAKYVTNILCVFPINDTDNDLFSRIIYMQPKL